MSLVSERGDRRRFATASVIALALIALFAAVSTRAQAAETVYWDNYRADPASVSFSGLDGNGGGALNLTGITLDSPEGMAFDSATGRPYIASSEGGTAKKGEIVFANIDGSGAGVLNTSGAEVNAPYGVAVDPGSRMIYWANASGGVGDKGTIAYARLDGSGGGNLNTSGVEVDDPYRVAIDPAGGRIYWGNFGDTPSIGYANLNNTGGGGTLALPKEAKTLYGLAVDSAAGRVYWLDSSKGDQQLLFVNVNGSGGGEVNLAGALLLGGYGLSIDTSIGRLYWANYGEATSVSEAIGFVNLAGGGGSITPTSAPVNGAQDPVIIKSPTGTGVPPISRNAKDRAALGCSEGSWAPDLAGSFFYQAPVGFAYQWTRDGTAVPGATANAFTATKPGSYACVVTASNSQGSTAQTSATANVKAAKIKLTTKKKAKADAGDLVTFKVKAVNQGDLAAKKNAKLCVKLPNAAKDDLKAPKCKKLGLKGRGKKTLTLKIKVKPAADEGIDKLTFQVKGSAGKAAKSKIVVR